MKLSFKIALLFVAGIVGTAQGQMFPEGSISQDFELPERGTNETFNLYSLEGHIIVLDFFAFWCAPCAFSSPDIEANVFSHYQDRDGNPDGLPVTVVSLNLEKNDPMATDQFAAETGMNLVVDDVDFEVFGLYDDTGGIPLFVVINGVSGAQGVMQWEVLLNQAGYPGSAALRELIDGVRRNEDGALHPFEGLPDMGDGWRNSDWFGWLNTESSPDILHAEHGWLYFPEQAEDSVVTYFDYDSGWIVTSSTIYPNLYNYSLGDWLLYLVGSGEWYWSYVMEEWIQIKP